MKIALVVPLYNSRPFLEPLVRAVAASTDPPDEVVFADDGSTDGTLDALARLTPMLPGRVEVIRLAANTGGPAGPVNAAVERTTADYVMTLDHDDLPDPGRVAVVRRTAAALPQAGLFVGRMTQSVPGSPAAGLLPTSLTRLPGRPVGDGLTLLDPAAAYRGLWDFRSLAMSCSQFHFPRWAWAAVGGMDRSVRTCVDLAFYEAVARRFPVAVVDRTVVHRVVHGDNLSGQLAARFWDQSDVLQRVHEFYRTRPVPAGGVTRLRAELLGRAYGYACLGRYAECAAAVARAVGRYGVAPAVVFDIIRCGARAAYNTGRRGLGRKGSA